MPFVTFLGLLIALVVAVGFIIVSRYRVAKPNEAFIVTGRKGKAVINPETGVGDDFRRRRLSATTADADCRITRPERRQPIASR